MPQGFARGRPRHKCKRRHTDRRDEEPRAPVNTEQLEERENRRGAKVAKTKKNQETFALLAAWRLIPYSVDSLLMGL
jgi:hypothetical protein